MNKYNGRATILYRAARATYGGAWSASLGRAARRGDPARASHL